MTGLCFLLSLPRFLRPRAQGRALSTSIEQCTQSDEAETGLSATKRDVTSPTKKALTGANPLVLRACLVGVVANHT